MYDLYDIKNEIKKCIYKQYNSEIYILDKDINKFISSFDFKCSITDEHVIFRNQTIKYNIIICKEQKNQTIIEYIDFDNGKIFYYMILYHPNTIVFFHDVGLFELNSNNYLKDLKKSYILDKKIKRIKNEY